MGRLLRKERLEGVDKRLGMVAEKAVRGLPFDLLVVEGLRTYTRQKELVEAGKSRTYKSKHLEGLAIDVAPQREGKVLWDDKAAFKALRTAMLEAAKSLNIKIRHGADWDLNGVIDETELAAYKAKFGRAPLVDYPHWELL